MGIILGRGCRPGVPVGPGGSGRDEDTQDPRTHTVPRTRASGQDRAARQGRRQSQPGPARGGVSAEGDPRDSGGVQYSETVNSVLVWEPALVEGGIDFMTGTVV